MSRGAAKNSTAHRGVKMNHRKKRNLCERTAGLPCRVWIVGYSARDFRPVDWLDVPPNAVAIEPAETEPMSPDRAHRYVEAFNRAAFGCSSEEKPSEKPEKRGKKAKKRWAVAVPVAVRYDGEPRPGEKLTRR
jgi:hypothetical protein